MEKLPIFDDDHILPRTEPFPFMDTMSKCWTNFINTYRSYIDEFYAEQFEEIPTAFPFKQPLHWVLVYENHRIMAHVFKSDRDYCEHKIFQFITLGESRAFKRLPPYMQKERKSEIIGRDETPLTIIEFKYGFPAPSIIDDPDYVTEDPEDMIKIGEIQGRELAKLHGEGVRKEIEERFNLFNLEAYVPRVADEHFDYEIGEAIAAYKQELYLAATAVAGVALENILVLILKKNELFSKNIKPYIKDYLKVLVDNDLLDERKRKDIMNFNNTRNGAAHSNSGIVMANHAEEGFSIIKYFIQKFY